MTPAAAASAAMPTVRLPPVTVMVLGALMSLGSLATDMYLPALPTLRVGFGVGDTAIQLTLSTFLVGFAGGQLIWGPIGDRFGRRVPSGIGLALFILGAAGCALSGSVGAMIFWRCVQAFGAAAGPSLARAMVRDLYRKDQAARILSLLLLVMGIAPLLGPTLGGVLLQHLDWHSIFWVQVILGLLALAGLATVKETLRPDMRASLRPADLIVGYAELLMQRRLLGYALAGAAFYGAVYAYLAGTPFAYIELHHLPAQYYGLLFGLNIVGMMGMNMLNTRLVPRFGGDAVLRGGVLVIGLAGLAIAVTARTGLGGLAGLVVPVFVLISMNGAVVANSVAGALAAFPRRAGAASALIGAMQFGAGILTTALVGLLADGTAFPYAAIICVCGLLGMASSLLLLRGPATEA